MADRRSNLPYQITIACACLVYMAVLAATGNMLWRSQYGDAADLAFRDRGITGGRVEFAQAYYPEYRSNHDRSWADWNFGFPLGIFGTTVFFFLPTLVAVQRKHPQLDAIIVGNTLTGISGVGWVIVMWYSCRRIG